MKTSQDKRGTVLIFLVLSIFFFMIAAVFGKLLSPFDLKIISCGFCLTLLGLLVSAYRYECQQFEKRDDLTRLRNFGVSINPHSLAGKIIFLLALIVVIAIFAVLLFAS
nr:hypothetical protein [Streptococcus lutetiensis]